MTKTDQKRYRAPAALLCLCMLFSMLGGIFPLPAAAAAAGPVTPETAQTPQGTAAPAPAQTPPEQETDPAAPDAPPSTPETVPVPPEAAQATPEKAPATPETVQATPAQAQSTPEQAISTPEQAPATLETAAACRTTQAPRQALRGLQTEIYVPHAPADKQDAAAADTLEEAVERAATGGTIWLTQDVTVDTVTLDGGRSVTIRSCGGDVHTIRKEGSGANMFVLLGGASLTLENVIVDAGGNTAGRTVAASGKATLTLNRGAVLQNNTAHGAVWLDGAALVVNGGAIRDNTAAGETRTKEYEPSGTWKTTAAKYVFHEELAGKQGLGGAVLMAHGATLTVSDGEISGNKAVCGGAVYAWAAGEIRLNGGTFSANTAAMRSDDDSSPATGGALCVDGGETNAVTVAGTSFTGNSAKQGGALYFGIDAGKVDLTMTGGTFAQNTSTDDGSMIYSLAPDGVMDIGGSGSVFERNTANTVSGSGGGIYQGMYPGNPKSARAMIRIHDGAKFTQNSAHKGSCLYVTRDGGTRTLILDGALFSNNTTTKDAGVVQYNVPDSTFTVRGCQFTDNRTENRGGCFYVSVDAKGTRFTFEDTTFTNNSAKAQGGVWRGFAPESELQFKNCTFTGNTAETGDGGCFYCPGDGTDANVIIDGGTFTGNRSGSSGGAFRVNLNGGSVTVKGGAVFKGNTADVNAGAFSIRRKGAGYYGEAYLLECDVIDNVCNADFSRYTEADLEPTKHYNTGGVYIGENITCYLYDALITENYVESGYQGKTVGSGIGLCPNAEVRLYPEHGALVCGNGKPGTETMDILAVPYDETIDHETPARLYVSDVTPDGRAYNWTDLQGGKARTGEYDWTNARSGLGTAALAGGYRGETTLDPVGFKANITEAPARRQAVGLSGDGYKVRITGNHTKNALYAAGGVMVNGTVIAGDFSVSVQKQVTVNGASAEKTTELETQQEYSFRLSIVDTGTASGVSALKEPGAPIPFLTEKGQRGSLTFTKGTTTLTGEEPGFEGSPGTYDSLSCTFTLQGEDKLTVGKIDGADIGINGDDDTGRYFFLLEETDSGGATVDITAPDDDGSGSDDDVVFAFTCTNTFDFGTLALSKTVAGAAGETDRLWTFTIALTEGASGPALRGTFPVEISGTDVPSSGAFTQGGLTYTDGRAQLTFDEDGKATVCLKSGQTLKVLDLPAGTQYIVTEQEDSLYGYTTEKSNETGSIESNETAAAAFTNRRATAPTGGLTVAKRVTGAGDRSKEFHFTVEFDPKTLLAASRLTVTKNGRPAPGLAVSDGRLTFTLKDGENLTVEGLPAGTAYTVTETEANAGGYTTTVTDNDGANDGSGVITAETLGQVRFVNALPGTPPPSSTPGPTPGPTPKPTPRPTPRLTPRPTPVPTPKPTAGPVPATGDSSPVGMWAALLLAALLGLLAAGLTLWRRRHGKAQDKEAEK